MKTSFDEKINELTIPDALDTRISMGFREAKLKTFTDKNRMKKRFTALAASLAFTFLALGFIGFDNVGAAIKEALKYIPGLNVLVEKQDGDLLVLQDQVVVKNEDHYLTLKSAVQNGNSLHLTIESNLGLETDTKIQENMEKEENLVSNSQLLQALNLTLRDSNGEVYTAESWWHSSGGTLWSHNASFVVNEESTTYVLEAGGMKVDFTLAPSRGVDALEDLGPYAKDKGITVVGLLKRDEDRVRVDLVHAIEEGRLSSYPLEKENVFALFGSDFDLESLHLLDKEGNKTYPLLPTSYSNPLSEFSFNSDPAKAYSLSLPYMMVTYPEVRSKKFTLSTPQDGETITLDKSVSLGKFTVDLLNMTRKGDEVIIHLASKALESEILASFSVEGVSGYGFSYEEPEGPILILSYMDIGSRFSIRFTKPESLLHGEWVIDLSK